jgi:hypothetical protein
MAPPVDLRSVNITHKNAKIQYTYSDTTVEKKDANYQPNYSINDKNFTFADDGLFFSGYCNNISIVKPTHNIQNGVSTVQDADLVLTHTRTTNGTGVFYVIIPLVQDITTTGSEVDKMMELSPSFVLNNDLKNVKPNVTCYKDKSTSNYVFVFDKPILVKGDYSKVPSSSINFSGIQFITSGKGKKKKTTSTAFVVKNNQNIDEEIECEYVTQTDATAKPADKKTLMKFLTWSFILLGLFLCMVYALTLVSSKAEPDAANTVFMVCGGVGIILLIIHIRLFTRTTTKKVEYGSMTIFSIMVILLSLLAYNGMLKAPVVMTK